MIFPILILAKVNPIILITKDYIFIIALTTSNQDFNIYRAYALCYGPRAQTVSREVSTYFFIEFHDNTRGIKFLYQNFSCNRLKLKNKTQVIPGHKKKCAVTFYNLSIGLMKPVTGTVFLALC